MTSFSDVSLSTERFILRPLIPNDAASLFQIFSDVDVMRYWNTPPWASIEVASRFIETSKYELEDKSCLTLAIEDKSNGQLVGKCMLFSFHIGSKRAEIGFGIAKQYWGVGVVPEVGNTLIKFGFQELGLRRIEAEIDPENRGSASVLKKMGFKKEGYLRQRWEINGQITDSELYGLLASDLVQS